ncbi:MAG: protein-L-isoaspartate(D-aspartate) O-methyltransferase [Desulfobacteraceae bacterium]|jgi:protein-L-isoaspartate(D-aspartate) O-methyltransferase
MKKFIFFLIPVSLCLIPALLVAGTLKDFTRFKKARERLVLNYIENKGIKDPGVLAAMRKVQRHSFVPDSLESSAYADRPLPIGEGQTISQPYVVALMTEILQLNNRHRVLEIGTGSGYQAAVLAQIAGEVYSIEIKQKLYKRATNNLKSLHYKNVKTRHGDGYFGWQEAAPFDAIMITAAVDHIPPPLIKQLKDGGRLALPLGNPFSYQNLVLVTKQGDDVSVKQITGVLFVPMTGVAMERRGHQPNQ